MFLDSRLDEERALFWIKAGGEPVDHHVNVLALIPSVLA